MLNTRLPIPHHVAIIPDGNRRWASLRGEEADVGHFHGTDRIHEIVKAAHQFGVKVLTFYGFSTENWSRSPEEVEGLFALMKETIARLEPKMVSDGVCLETIGDLSLVPADLQAQIAHTRAATKAGTSMVVILAINYGGRSEILRACMRLKAQGKTFSEEMLASCLDTAPWGDPELLIRTSGEQRISNFLLWQSAYTELYFSPKLWPDFTEQDLFEALVEYQKRVPRMGG